MLAEKAENPAVTPVTHRASFFRESGWLMIANVTGGALNWAVHFMAKRTGPTEYGVFLAFLAVAMCIPSMPLQLVFAQQTAKGIATDRQPQLARLIRLTWLATFLFWAVSAVVVLIFQGTILERWKIPNPAALWVAVPMVLFSIWGPIFSGVLQGQQNFLWLGWSMILNAVVRLGVAVLAVLALGGYATGMLTGVLLGMAVAALIGIWCTRDLWIGHSLPFEWLPV